MSQAISSVPAIVRRAATTPGGVVPALVAALRWVRREWRVHRDLMRIEGLDDRALADLGIGRGEVEDAVRYGRRTVASRSADRVPAERPLMPESWTEWR